MTSARRLWWRHLVSVLIAPATVTVLVPGAICWLAGFDAPPLGAVRWPLGILGAAFVAAGVGMLVWTVVLFDRVGEGTLGIGEPVRLVVRGPYRRVRNPMMTGVFSILVGEVLLTASPWLLAWCAFFVALTTVVIRVIEEPHLTKRYGPDYERYRRHVPRWIPQRTPWDPPAVG